MIFKCPGSTSFKQPKPEDIRCPQCGNEVEIWSDEVEIVCPQCKHAISRPQAPSCLEWCKHAKECVSPAIYERYLRNKSIHNKENDKERHNERKKSK